MKKLLFATLTALTVFALVMTGCPTDGGTEDGKKSDVRTLGSISLEGGDQKVSPGNGARGDTLSDLLTNKKAKDLNLPAAVTGQVGVTLTFGSGFKGSATIAQVEKGGTVTEGNFNKTYTENPKTEFIFTDEDQLFVKVTAENGSSSYYWFKVLIGWDASLSDIILVDAVTELAVGNVDVTLGEPGATAAAAEEGKIQFNAKGNKFGVKGVATDEAAKVGISLNGTDWITLKNGDDVTFADDKDNFLYFEVKSSNDKNTNYYKVKVVTLRSVDIPYGTPAKIDANDIDDAWWNDDKNATGWLDINRLNKTETGTTYEDAPLGDRTFGRAKLAWDEGGMYIYAQVWEINITQTEESGSSNHTVSSVELFINESNSRTGTVASSVNENGGQYRLGANNVRSGPQSNQTDAFNALNRSSAKKWTNGDFPYTMPNIVTNVKNGYVVMFQAPWLFPDKYPLVDNKALTIEIQINAINPQDSNGGRVGVLNWNNENSNSYNQVDNFGDATLKLNGNTMGALGAQITTQPKNQSIKVGSGGTVNELSVDATSPDSGTLTFEWYKVTSAVAEGGDKVGEGKTYTPTGISTDAAGVYYYYAKVTNTKGTLKPSVRTSNVTIITVYVPAAASGDIELLPPTVTKAIPASYGDVIPLPFSVELGDYTKLEVWYSIANAAKEPPDVPNNNDFFIEVMGSDGVTINVPDGEGGYNGVNYNASGLLTDDSGNFAGTYYNITPAYAAAVGGGQAKITIKHKPDNGNGGKDVTITSVKLILK